MTLTNAIDGNGVLLMLVNVAVSLRRWLRLQVYRRGRAFQSSYTSREELCFVDEVGFFRYPDSQSKYCPTFC